MLTVQPPDGTVMVPDEEVWLQPDVVCQMYSVAPPESIVVYKFHV
jgi:hypothetical protein